MKYILVTGGVISGVGKGVIASSIGTLLKSAGLGVTSIKIDPYINIDAGTFSPYEHEIVLKAKWKGLRDNFRVEYKRIPRADNGDFLVDPATFESKWLHYYALLFLSEVYVLDDGAEVDLDLGNYERFLDVTLHRDNNITTGKIYRLVIERERRGDYLGKTVQVVPHITDAIQEWVENVAQTPVDGSSKPQVCIIELGGTIGDIEGMPFVEAFRQFQFRVKRENFCVAHVSLVPLPKATGEPKTKPTQSSVRELRGCGLSPDLIVCRSEKPIGVEVKQKISNFCHVEPDQVICIHDLSSIYHVPLLMEQNGVIEFLNERLQLNIDMSKRARCLQHWRDLARRTEIVRREVNIAIVGKYTKFTDSYASVVKAIQHAALAVNRKPNLIFIESCLLEHETQQREPAKYHKEWQRLCESDGVLVPGGFGSRGMEGKIEACKWARENHKPFLGICLGLQAAVIEFARNVLGLKDVHSTEIKPEAANPLVIDMPEHHIGQMGGTMRLGKRTTIFNDKPSIIRQLYGNPKTVDERHRHRYEVNPQYVSELEKHGMNFVGTDEDNKRMEIIELRNHSYFVATQYHPEYLSRPLKPSPLFLGLILAAEGRLQTYIDRGCRLTPRLLSDASSDEEESVNGTTQITHTLNGLKIPVSDKQSLPPINGLVNGKNGISGINEGSNSHDEILDEVGACGGATSDVSV